MESIYEFSLSDARTTVVSEERFYVLCFWFFINYYL